MAARTKAELEAQAGRQAHQLGAAKRNLKKAHDNLRLLENAVREHTYGRCECRSWRECSIRLAKLVPTKERAKLK